MWPFSPRILPISSWPEAVHHRHDDDQRGDAEHDADEGEAGDDRDEGLAPARTQIAAGKHPFEPGERPGAGRKRRPRLRCLGHRALLLRPAVSRFTAASTLIVSRSPVARRLTSTSPCSSPFGPDDDLPGQADQVHRGELGAGALVEVIVEHRNSGFRKALVQRLAGRIDRRVAGLEVDQADLEGRHAVRPDDAGIVVARLDDRRRPGATRRCRRSRRGSAARRRPARRPTAFIGTEYLVPK